MAAPRVRAGGCIRNQSLEAMSWRKENREPERWYLLPAMQHGARRKFIQRLTAAVVVGVLTAAALGAMIYYANRI